MAKLKFDGTSLKDGAKTIANVSGNNIREGSGPKTVANINGNNIREGNGPKVMFNISGNDIRQGNSPSKIATMKDVDAQIEGPGKVVKAALWLYFCR